jgi:hypothetical protein
MAGNGNGHIQGGSVPPAQGTVKRNNHMKSFKVRIEGTTPLLMNNFHDEAAQSATSGTRMSSIGDKGTPKEQAEMKLYTGNDGKPMIPLPNLFRCIIDAGKFHKAGKSKVTTIKSSIIPACVEVNTDDGVTVAIESNEPWQVDTRPVRIPSTGGRILAHRPKFDDWSLEFDVSVDTEMMSAKMLRAIIDDAGKRIGLGDFRPDCKGVFGKFVVTRWEEVPAEAA